MGLETAVVLKSVPDSIVFYLLVVVRRPVLFLSTLLVDCNKVEKENTYKWLETCQTGLEPVQLVVVVVNLSWPFVDP
jgi:hypothetical protein